MTEIFPELDGVELPPEKHSRVGIVSFVLSILLGVVFFVSFCICVSLTLETQRHSPHGAAPGPEMLLPGDLRAEFQETVFDSRHGLFRDPVADRHRRAGLHDRISRLISGNFRKIRAIQLDFYMICDSLLRKQTNHADRAEHLYPRGEHQIEEETNEVLHRRPRMG